MITPTLLIVTGLVYLQFIEECRCADVRSWTLHRIQDAADSVTTPIETEIVRYVEDCYDRYYRSSDYLAANILQMTEGWKCEWLGTPSISSELTPTPGTIYVGTVLSSAGPLYAPNEYSYQPVDVDLSTETHIRVIVKACNDAHLVLSSQPSAAGDLYEIVLGGWSNQKSVIRKCLQGCSVLQSSTPAVMSCNEEQRFWLSWERGLLKVGSGWRVGYDVIMEYIDTQPPAINYLSISNGFGSDGLWSVYL